MSNESTVVINKLEATCSSSGSLEIEIAYRDSQWGLGRVSIFNNNGKLTMDSGNADSKMLAKVFKALVDACEEV